jgi:hypothetical protein
VRFGASIIDSRLRTSIEHCKSLDFQVSMMAIEKRLSVTIKKVVTREKCEHFQPSVEFSPLQCRSTM